MSALIIALFFITAVPFFSVKIYNAGNPQIINISGLGLLSGQPYNDYLSSASHTAINGNIFYGIPVIFALAVIVLQFIKLIKPKILVNSNMSPISLFEFVLPLLGILSMFLVKIGFDNTAAQLPHYLTGDMLNEYPDKKVLADINWGFILFIILNALVLLCAVYGQIKKDPAITGNFRNTRIIVLTSLFISLAVVGDLISIPVAKDLFVKFGFIFMSAIAFMFGPIVAFGSGIIIDILSFLINSQGYTFDVRYTISAGVAGILYSIFLYKRNPDSPFFIINILLAKASVNFIINIVLNQIWLSSYYGKTSAEIFTLIRIFKNVAMLPIEMLIMFFVLRVVSKAAVNLNFIKPRRNDKPAVTSKE